jgi:hypothetical protein
MSQVTFAKILGRTFSSSAAVLLLGVGAATAGSPYDPQNAAQALLAHTVSAPAQAGAAGVHGIGAGNDAQESARRMIVGQLPKPGSARGFVVASSSRLSTREDANSLARRMILGGV